MAYGTECEAATIIEPLLEVSALFVIPSAVEESLIFNR